MTVSEPATTVESTDGRTARAHRTRHAVVDALLALIDEGDIRPTGPRIADRAGVSLRSVFQHFNDLESLFAVAGERQLERIAAMTAVIDPGRPLAERLVAFCAQRARVLEFLTPVRRASLVQEPFSSQLQANRDSMLALARAEIRHVFARELVGADDEAADIAAAVDAASSWGAWDALRHPNNLSPAAAQRVLTRLVASALGHPELSLSD